MKKEILTIDNHNYEMSQIVSFTFLVTDNNIDSFLKHTGIVKYQISGMKRGIISNVDRSYKEIKITTLSVFLYEIMKKLGMKDSSELRDYFTIYRFDFDKRIVKPIKFTKFAIYSKNKGFRTVPGTHIKFEGNQIRHENMLLRRYKN